MFTKTGKLLFISEVGPIKPLLDFYEILKQILINIRWVLRGPITLPETLLVNINPTLSGG